MAVIVTAAVGGKLKQKNIHAEIVQNLIEDLPESMRPLIWILGQYFKKRTQAWLITGMNNVELKYLQGKIHEKFFSAFLSFKTYYFFSR